MINIRKMILKELPALYEYNELCNKLAVFLENADEQKCVYVNLTLKRRGTGALLRWFKKFQSGDLTFSIKGKIVLKILFRDEYKTNKQLIFWVKTQLKDLVRN